MRKIKLTRTSDGYSAGEGFFRVRPWASPVDPSTRWGWHLFVEAGVHPQGKLIDTVGTLAEVRDLIATIYADAEATPGSGLYAAAIRCMP